MTDEKKKSPYDILKESPMFQLSLASKELFHSNFLAWIGSWEGDKGPEHPFRQLMNKLGASHAVEPDSWGKDWYVAREYKNFDLCVLDSIPEDFDESEDSDDSEENGKKQPHVLLVLENKVKSIPNIEQLHEYQDKIIDINFDWIKNAVHNLKYKWQFNEKDAQKHKDQIEDDPDKYVANNKKTAIDFLNTKTDFLLLSMSETFPDKGVVDKEQIWCYKSYLEYSKLLDNLCDRLEPSLSKSIIENYVLQLKSLLELHKDWTGDEFFLENRFLYYKKNNDKGRTYRFNYPKLKQLRIHDLFQKQRYAKICSILKKKIETNIVDKMSNLECVSRLDLAKDNLKNKVFVGFNFLHGEPLLDIWLGTGDFVYTIQIQGDSYEHGIQKKLAGGKNKGENSIDLWNLIWKDKNAIAQSVNGWNWICPFKVTGDQFGKDDNGKEYFPIVQFNNNNINIFEKNSIIYPQNPRKRGDDYFPFLKYEMDSGVTFIYQYRKISDNASVGQVIDYIVADLDSLRNIVLKK